MHVFRSLIDERGPWSAMPFPNRATRHWKLDKTEDTWRRRQKLRQNYHFDEKLCHPSSSASEKEAVVATCENESGDGVPIPEQMKRFLLKGIRRITEEVYPEASESDNESRCSKEICSEEVPDVLTSVQMKDDEQKGAVQERKDTPSPAFEIDSGQVYVNQMVTIVYVNTIFSLVSSSYTGSCDCTLHYGISKEKASWSLGSVEKCLTFLC